MRVICKQTSNDGKATPSEIQWSVGDDVSAILSVAQLLQHAKADEPWSPRILEIRIEL